MSGNQSKQIALTVISHEPCYEHQKQLKIYNTRTNCAGVQHPMRTLFYWIWVQIAFPTTMLNWAFLNRDTLKRTSDENDVYALQFSFIHYVWDVYRMWDTSNKEDRLISLHNWLNVSMQRLDSSTTTTSFVVFVVRILLL